MSEHKLLFAGFGGQGILFAGKLIAYAGMLENKEVTWLPSYGPEMRGGTANCRVIVSSSPVGSPLVVKQNAIIVMNLPSFDKFEADIEPGGMAFIDSTLITREPQRKDIKTFMLPATAIADEHGMAKLANVILCGKLIKETGVCSMDIMPAVLEKCVPASKKGLIDLNMKALTLGYEYIK